MDAYTIMQAWRRMQDAVEDYGKATDGYWTPGADDASDELREAFRELANLIQKETAPDAGGERG
jgi:hypothetical protein